MLDGTSAYARRMTEFVAYCPLHIGIGMPAYHVGYQEENGKRERLFECYFCHHEFTEPHGMDCDLR
jgi:hypothetical protein